MSGGLNASYFFEGVSVRAPACARGQPGEHTKQGECWL